MSKGKCPNCGGDLVEKDSKNGTFLSCSNFPKCRFSMDYRPDYKELDLTNLEECPNCGGKLIKKDSKKGAFLSCSNFPKCRFSMDFKGNEETSSQIDNGEDSLVCPECGGELKKREGKYGTFLGCSNFPKCRYSRDI